MDMYVNDQDDFRKLEPETVAVGLVDLTRDIVDDDEALKVMLKVVAIALEWRTEAEKLWN